MNGGKERDQPFIRRLKIGMRVIKTVMAVFLCCLIEYFRGVSPLQSAMAAIICIQPDTENTVNMAVSRILATLLGSVTATALLMILTDTGIAIPSIPFYLILSLLLIPLITVTVKMGWPSATALTCIIFLAIALGYNEETSIFMAALNRMIDTLVGILVALPVNALLPNRLATPTGGSEEETTEPPAVQSDESREADGIPKASGSSEANESPEADENPEAGESPEHGESREAAKE